MGPFPTRALGGHFNISRVSRAPTPVRRRLSPRLGVPCRRLATEMPYHRAAAVLRELTAGQAPALAMTVWRATQRAVRRLGKAAERLPQSVFGEGRCA